MRRISMKYITLVSLLLFALLSCFMLSSLPDIANAEVTGVYIQGDGTVQGTNSIQHTGDSYTFVGDFAGPLYVQRDNIVIDGAGHTVTGGNGRGVVLQGRHGVTLKNTRITLDGGYVVNVEDASDCTLVGNTLIGTPQPIPGLPTSRLIGPIAVNFLHSVRITVKDNMMTNFMYALSLEWSSGHTITGNTLIDGIVGISIVDTTDCVFRNNHLVNSSFSLRVYPSYEFENDLDSSNTIDGKPIYYWLNIKDKIVPSDASYIALVGCENIKVENATPEGIALVSSKDSTISKVTLEANDGIDLLNSTGIRIINSVLHGTAIALDLQNSSNNTISGNEFSNTKTRGINFGTGGNNLISANTFVGNSYAIAPFQDSASNGNIIMSNRFTNNTYALTLRGTMNVQGNIFENNNVGLLLYGGSESTIMQNSFINNTNAVYISGSSGNTIYLNNFIDNTHQVSDAGASSSLAQTSKTNSNLKGSLQLAVYRFSEVNFIPPPPQSTNRWDNGSKGNFWSDYHGSDVNSDGVGDTAYYLYENNRDNYPLMNSVTVSGVSIVPDNQLPEFPVGSIVTVMLIVFGIAIVGACFFITKKKRITSPLTASIDIVVKVTANLFILRNINIE